MGGAAGGFHSVGDGGDISTLRIRLRRRRFFSRVTALGLGGDAEVLRGISLGAVGRIAGIRSGGLGPIRFLRDDRDDRRAGAVGHTVGGVKALASLAVEDPVDDEFILGMRMIVLCCIPLIPRLELHRPVFRSDRQVIHRYGSGVLGVFTAEGDHQILIGIREVVPFAGGAGLDLDRMPGRSVIHRILDQEADLPVRFRGIRAGAVGVVAVALPDLIHRQGGGFHGVGQGGAAGAEAYRVGARRTREEAVIASVLTSGNGKGELLIVANPYCVWIACRGYGAGDLLILIGVLDLGLHHPVGQIDGITACVLYRPGQTSEGPVLAPIRCIVDGGAQRPLELVAG